jgi:hypothetical protein
MTGITLTHSVGLYCLLVCGYTSTSVTIAICPTLICIHPPAGTKAANKNQMKKLLSVVLVLLSVCSHAQVSHAYNPNPPGTLYAGENLSKTPGLTTLTEKDDDMTGKVLYFDPRCSIHHLKGSGIYATIIKDNGWYSLRLTAYHVARGAVMINGIYIPGETPEDVTGILIKVKDTLFNFENTALIQGSGTAFSHMTISGDSRTKDNFAYKVLSRILDGDYAKVRFESSPTIEDYELSDREISEIKNVVNAWLAVNNIE